VGGVTGKEDSTLLVVPRHVRGGPPAGDPVDPHGEIGHAGADANQIDQPSLAGVDGGVRRIARPRGHRRC